MAFRFLDSTVPSSPGIGDNVEKMREKLETRLHCNWHRDLVAQSEAAIKLFDEAV